MAFSKVDSDALSDQNVQYICGPTLAHLEPAVQIVEHPGAIIVGPKPYLGMWIELKPFEALGVFGVSGQAIHQLVDGSGLPTQATFVENIWGGTAIFANIGMPYDPPKEAEVIGIVEEYVAALNDAFVGPDKDTSSLMAMMAPDANVEFPLGTARVSGHENIEDYFHTLLVGTDAPIELATDVPEYAFAMSPGYGHVSIVIKQAGAYSMHVLHLSYDPHPIIEEFGTLFIEEQEQEEDEDQQGEDEQE